MKLKYKKMIIMVSMCTMGIGMVVFSTSHPAKKENNDGQKIVAEGQGDVSPASLKNETPETGVLDAFRSIDEPDDTNQITETPEADKKEDVVSAPLEKNEDKKINKLIKKYLNAKLGTKLSAFEDIVSDTSFLDMDDMIRKNSYIEGYDNIEVYTKKGIKEGSYVVYAYHEVKFTSIDTLAPAMNEFYIEADEEGNPIIYLGKIDGDTKTYLDEVRNSEEVMELIYKVNDDLKNAVEKDNALAEFYVKLEESAKKVADKE